MKLICKIKQHTYERMLSLSEKDVFDKQSVLLNDILLHAVKHVPFYKKLGLSESNLNIKDFPIVDKHIISNSFNDFCSDKKESFSYSNAYTGGSTGEPFHLILSGGYEYEFGVKRWKEYGYREGMIVLAMDGTKINPEERQKNIYWARKNKNNVPFGSWALSSLYINDNNAKFYCDFIELLKPDFIRGYPSFVYALACYAQELGIDLGTNVKAVELTSETAFPYQIDKIREVYGAEVYLQYGHTEGCICAYTYDHTFRYRVEPLYGYAEIIKEDGTYAKPGEIGEVVVTTLHNYAMPLIRYRTGDFAEYGGNDNRYMYLNKVMGRSQDYIIDKDGNRILLTALIFAQHCKALGNIQKWQLEQSVGGEVVAHIVKGQGYTGSDESEIKKLFLTSGNVDTVFDYVQSIQLTPRGKSKMLVQHLSIE